MPAPGIAILAPTRRRTALAILGPWQAVIAIPAIAGGIATERLAHSAGAGWAAGIAIALVLFAPLYWRAYGIQLTIDSARGQLVIRNLCRTRTVTPATIREVTSGTVAVGIPNRTSFNYAQCLQVATQDSKRPIK